MGVPAFLAPRASSTDGELTLLMQRRLSLLHGILGAIIGFMMLSNAVLFLAGRLPPSMLGAFPTIIGTGSTLFVALLASWRWCGGSRRFSRPVLGVIDVVGILVVCFAMTAGISQAREALDTSVLLFLALTYMLITRSIVVPSTGRRTLLIAVTAMVPACLVAINLRLRTSGTNDLITEGSLVVRMATITTVLASLASRVIYGLQRQVVHAKRVGQYVLDQKIGQGGMGVVYRATHALLRRATAVKLLAPGRVAEADLQRFEREVRMTARLTHPSTVAIFDYGRTADGLFYYAMEYLDGADLDELVAFSGPLGAGRVVRIVEQVCRALREAHGAGLVHRDIKPANVLLCERGGEGDVAKLVDFGLVRDLQTGADPHLTAPDSITGTPLYLAPECISAPSAADARSDLYALGAVAYFLLTATPVFSGSTVEVCAHHLHTAPPPPSSRTQLAIPASIEAIVLRCLSKKPADRYASAEALREALVRCGDFDAWSDQDAASWWADHGAALRAQRDGRRVEREHGGGHDASPLDRAVTVDWNQRRGQLS